MAADAPRFNPTTLDSNAVTTLLRQFVDTRQDAEQATVDDLVRVRVGPALHLENVEILEPGIDDALKRRLETAIVGAVNTALRRATLGAAAAVHDDARQRAVGARDENDGPGIAG